MTNTEAWDYAIGMIKVDGLEPTKEFKEYIGKRKARRNYNGRILLSVYFADGSDFRKKEYLYKIVYDADEGISEMGERNGDD